MKIKFDIECTPEEARSFLGLPDVKPMQEKILKELQDRMVKSISITEMPELSKIWFPNGLDGLQSFQKAFWEKMAFHHDEQKSKKK